jgi:cytochrome c biogenesis protein CcmG/thiol:disulfide interchange protein DsbE
MARISTFALILVGLYAAVTLYTNWIARDERTATPAPAFHAITLDNHDIELPLKDQRSILVFWATWCGPCKIELARLKDAVEQGEIPKEKVIAVSIGESLETVQATAKERGYPFVIAADESGRAGELYHVRVTPTVIHVDEKQSISWVAQGVHPLSRHRAIEHLKN